MDRLRRYETQKLKYYFAVVTCSSLSCSAHLYSQCDGLEFEQTSNLLDLRFIPDDLHFDLHHLRLVFVSSLSTTNPQLHRDSANEVPSNYSPSEFYTSALKHTQVKCSWDAEDPNRQEFFRRKISNLNPDDRDIEVFFCLFFGGSWRPFFEDIFLQIFLISVFSINFSASSGVFGSCR